jgi:hypothetical protein
MGFAMLLCALVAIECADELSCQIASVCMLGGDQVDTTASQGDGGVVRPS